MSATLIDLNDDCLCEILKYVSLPDQVQLAKTCRRLRLLIVYEWEIRWKSGELNLNEIKLGHLELRYFIDALRHLVRSIVVKRKYFESDVPQDAKFRKLYFWSTLKGCPNLKALTLRHMANVDGKQLAQHLPQLEALDLKGSELIHEDVEAIFGTLRLKRLNLLNVRQASHEKFNLVFSLTGEPFAQLEELKITLEDYCNSIHDVFRLRQLKALTLSHFGPSTRLVHLDTYIMGRIREVYGSRLYHFELRYILDASYHFTKRICLMTELTVLKFHYTTLEQLSEVAAVVLQLRELSFNDCNGVTDEEMLDFVRNCHRLAVLDVRGCQGITDALIWKSGEILLKRNAGIRLQIMINQSSLSTDIVQQPGFVRLRPVLEITDNCKHVIRDPELLRNSFSFKFSECSDAEYDLLCRKLDNLCR